MHKTIEPPVLDLDFDGVLHPDAAHRIRSQIVLLSEGVRQFRWASVPTESLEPFQGIGAPETHALLLRRLEELTK